MKHRGQYPPCRRTDTPDSVSDVLQKKKEYIISNSAP